MEPDEKTITITGIDVTTDCYTIDLSDATTDCYTIDLSDAPTYASTLNIVDNHITSTHTLDNINIDWGSWDDTIHINKVEKMCNHYPGLEKVWRNFKSVYDMVKQDYEGKKKAGEIDDDIPF